MATRILGRISLIISHFLVQSYIAISKGIWNCSDNCCNGYHGKHRGLCLDILHKIHEIFVIYQNLLRGSLLPWLQTIQRYFENNPAQGIDCINEGLFNDTKH